MHDSLALIVLTDKTAVPSNNLEEDSLERLSSS
jgi:hypothetical protein